ncbi:MAG: aminotransferase class V-fold PLP-dependent enzyme [Alphaproteobacteria bacterium]|jgi:alanine-glyoxylate transaminase/serine-glyoxylate transaminase/serine-pyruvate transaminase|nr:aminotransferase class V-fold PLP-dependent enzyme [Alphaproteobacteria bacterium]MDP6565546.1 aminotransferase class V-fold PLP-dependent enzyme [Alphaproteobacteria bacterium]MDP6812085.1 aminotransferase class V-fold PLP-dependent enzyme [Alphaproteobacteria bacterium]
MTVRRGRNFLQSPGPTNIPDRVLNAMHQPAWEYSGPDFVAFARQCLHDIRPIFRTEAEVFIYAANGHGAWEAALANTLSPGDRVLVPETGLFSFAWSAMAEALGIVIDYLESDWRHGIDPNQVEERLRADSAGSYKAVLMIHTDTATGITSDIQAVRRAIDAAGHDALLMVDVIASLACTDFRMDDWGVDVAVGGSQKDLMCPPGLGFTAASEKARRVGETSTMPRNYWDWSGRTVSQPEGYRWFCGTAPEHLIFALREAMDMLDEEGLEAAFARHRRLADCTRAAVEAWSAVGTMELNALVPAERSESITTIRVAEGIDPIALQTVLRDRFNVSLGFGLGQLQGKSFRIGHMGDVNEPMILGTLASVEAGFRILGIPHGEGGMAAAVASLAAAHKNA